MTTTSMKGLLRHLRRIADPSGAAGVSDAELLERFVQRRDEAAFELLVRRHQRMVLGVCRRLLGSLHDAEDAFQATFFALARKADAIGRRQAVAGWLHTVAYRIALRVRAARGKKTDIDLATLAAPGEAGDNVVRRELAFILDEEVSRLPAKYRLAVVLCYLEGKSYVEAGRQLGLAVGTLAGHLTRARDLLRKRLTRRGIDVSGAVLTALLCEQVSSAATPAALVKAATSLAAVPSTAATSAAVAALAEGALGSMFVGKVKLGMAVLLAGLLVTGMGLLVPAALVSPVAVSETPPSAAPPAEGKTKRARVDDYGDPLPDGAIRRLGTLRFRHSSRGPGGIGGGIHHLLLTPDDKMLVSSDYYGSRKVCVWEMATGKLLRQLPGSFDDKNIALSPDGKLVAIAQKKAILLWDLASGKEVRRIAHPDANGVAFSPDGKILAAEGGFPDVHLWDLAAGKEIAKLPWERDTGGYPLLAFTPDGNTLIAGQRFDSKIALWDVASGKMRKELDAEGGDILSFVLSPDGAILATGCRQGGIPLWDVKTGKLIRKLRAESGKGCKAMVFSPNGKTLAATESDAKGHVFLSLWDVAAGKEARRFKSDMGVWSLVFSHNGKTLIAASVSAIRLLDAATGKEIGPTAGSPGWVGLATMSADGSTLAYLRHHDIRLWDMRAGREIGAIDAGPNGIRSLAFAPDGRIVAAGVGENTINLWDVGSRKLLRRLQGDKKESSWWPHAVAFSPDGRLLASTDSGAPAFIRLWDVASGKQIRRLAMKDADVPETHWPDANAVAFSSDGRMLVASGSTGNKGSKVLIWEVATGKELPHLTKVMNAAAHGDKPRSADGERKSTYPKVVLSPDGRMLARSGQPKTISVWETATGRRRLFLEGHEDSTECVAFAPDGRTLASASWDNTIRLWDLDTGRELRKLTGHRGKATSLAFSADGKTLVSTGDDTTVLFWDVADVAHHKHPGVHPITARQWEALWMELIQSDAAKAYTAMVRMTADGSTTISSLKERLCPVNRLDAEKLALLLKDLESDQFAVREKASRELTKLADAVQLELRRALARSGVSLDLRRRLEAILASIVEISGERLRTLRAIEVLEYLGTPGARQLLKALAAGAPGALATTAARHALKRSRTEK